MWGMGIELIMGMFTGKSTILYVVLGFIVTSVLGGIYWKYSSMKNEIADKAKIIFAQKIVVIDLENKLDALKVLNDENKKQVKKLDSKYKKTIESIEEKYKKQKVKTITVTKIKERIKYVNKKDNGSAANVLVNTFNRLREAQNPTKDDNSTKNKD